MIKKLYEKITGIAKIKEEARLAAEEAYAIAEEAKREAEAAVAESKEKAKKATLAAKQEEEKAKKLLKESNEAVKKAAEEERIAKLSPKERATAKKEPWICVLQTHINKLDIRNGFFELDWNEYFIKELIKSGYGTEHDPEEEVVDRWFRELCANVVVDGDFGGPVNTGILDVKEVLNSNT